MKDPKDLFLFRFLRWFCPEHLYEEIEGDLIQEFDRDIKKRGEKRAKRKLIWNTIRFFRPEITLRNKFASPLIQSFMLRSYLKIAVRNLLAHKVNTAINVVGLIIGIASALVIASIIRFELSFDQFHTQADRIYRIVRVSQVEGQEEYRTGVSYPLAPAIEAEISSIHNITSMLYWSWSGIQVDIPGESGNTGKKFQETSGFVFAQPSFFEVFDFPGTGFRWLAGNPQKALEEPNSVVLTRAIAKKYFDDINIVGKTLKIDRDWDCKVTGVIEDLPPNTDHPFTFFLSYATLMKSIGDRANSWGSVGANECYIVLPPSVSKEEMEAQIKKVHAAHTRPELYESRLYKLQPLSEVHQDSRFGNNNNRVVSREKVWTLAVVGIFLLVTACINYINLATARASLRSKEIGVRKVLGGRRNQLFFQFMSEAFLVSLVAGSLGLITAELIIANLQVLVSIKTPGFLFSDVFILKCLLIIVFTVTLLAGFYPALVISGFSPLAAIKNKLASASGGFQLRKVLVTAQFCLTQVFIIGTFVVVSQMEFFSSVDLGFDKEHILTLEVQNNDSRKLQLLRELLQSDPAIAGVSLSSTLPSGSKRSSNFADIRRKEADPKDVLVYEIQSADPEYLGLYNIQLSAGRNFTPADSFRYIVINHTLAMKAGFTSDEAALGHEMFRNGQYVTVIGVTKDFHSKSLKEEVDKIGIIMNPRSFSMVSIKLSAARNNRPSSSIQETIRRIERSWAAVFPESAISYQFFDENVAAFYEEETKFSKLMTLFSVVLLFIGCLGLYGLISFVVNRKLKEVAVRKVFGASAINILTLISRDYVRLILIAFLIAAPVTYYFVQQWLNSFVYHIEVSWWIMVLPGLIVLFIAMLAVSGQSLRAARSNPADTLKYE